MADLMVLAWQTDMTRVCSFQIGHEMGGRAYPEVGFGDAHHSVTHHSGDAGKIAKVIQINIFHMKLLAYYLDKLRSTPDGDGSLLDHALLLYGGALSDGNLHLYTDLPTLLVRRRCGRDQGRPAYPLSSRHADEQSLPHHAGQGQRSPRGTPRRQHRTARAAVRLSEGTMMRIRATIVAGLLGVPLFAGAALAADTGKLSLVEAAKQGNREVVASLLGKRGEEDLGGAEGTDALIWAATRNDAQMADLLLRAGADPKGANEYGATALYAAAASTDPAMTVRLLAAGADPNAHLLSGETPLMEAARRGNLETVRALLAAGADPNAQEVNGGQTALMWAISERHAAAAEALVRGGADIGARSKRGSTALMFAAQQSDAELHAHAARCRRRPERRHAENRLDAPDHRQRDGSRRMSRRCCSTRTPIPTPWAGTVTRPCIAPRWIKPRCRSSRRCSRTGPSRMSVSSRKSPPPPR